MENHLRDLLLSSERYSLGTYSEDNFNSQLCIIGPVSMYGSQLSSSIYRKPLKWSTTQSKAPEGHLGGSLLKESPFQRVSIPGR